MREKGVPFDCFTFPILNTMVVLLDESGAQCRVCENDNCVMMRMGFEADVYYCNTMINAHIKRGRITNALKLFNEMPYKDLVYWTLFISGHACEGNVIEAAALFNEMRKEVGQMRACRMWNLYQGRQMHSLAYKYGFSDHILSSTLLDLYANSADFETLTRLFRDISHSNSNTWGTMVSTLNENGYFDEAVGLFWQMVVAGSPAVTENLFTKIASILP